MLASVSEQFDRVLALRLLHQHDLNWDRRWSNLSRGQQRWALFAIGLAARPELWLLDEPTDGLDPATRRELYELLRIHCNDHGTTVVVSTHLIGDIGGIFDMRHAPFEQIAVSSPTDEAKVARDTRKQCSTSWPQKTKAIRSEPRRKRGTKFELRQP